MFNHYVLIKFRNGMDEADKRIAAYNIKKELENLNDKINGLVSLRVEHYLLPSSDSDIMIIERFENEEAMNAYAEAPLHLPIKKYMEDKIEKKITADFYD